MNDQQQSFIFRLYREIDLWTLISLWLIIIPSAVQDLVHAANVLDHRDDATDAEEYSFNTVLHAKQQSLELDMGVTPVLKIRLT